MQYKYDFSKEKDFILKETRGIGFKDIIEAIETKSIIDDIDHFNKTKYPNQRIFIVQIKENVYAVPYVIDKIRKVTFLKTIYRSRVLKKTYLK